MILMSVSQWHSNRSSSFLIAASAITGNRIFLLGETSGVTCSTPVPVESIQWLDESNRVVREGTSVQELVLNLTITAEHNNTRYTCRVKGSLESQSINITTGRKKWCFDSCVHICIFVCAYTVPPLVSVNGSSEGELMAGEDLSLTCTVTGGGTMTHTYRWLRNGSQLSDETSATLSFSPLRQTDSGNYSCEVTKSLSAVRSASITITVAGKVLWLHDYDLQLY